MIFTSICCSQAAHGHAILPSPKFTIMVNIASKRPKWDLATIQAQVRVDAFSLVNKRARTKVQSLGWKTDMIKSFLLSLRSQHFQKAYPGQSAYDGHKTLDVDGYKMHFDEDNSCEGNSKHYCYWAKLALEKSPAGGHVAIVSIHLDGSP